MFIKVLDNCYIIGMNSERERDCDFEKYSITFALSRSISLIHAQ